MTAKKIEKEGPMFVISTSLDGHHVYVDNDTYDERIMDFYFADSYTDEVKAFIFREIADRLEKNSSLNKGKK